MFSNSTGVHNNALEPTSSSLPLPARGSMRCSTGYWTRVTARRCTKLIGSALAVLFVGAACRVEDRRWLAVAIAYGRTRAIVGCLADHEARVGRYPESFSLLKETIQLGAPRCEGLDDEFMNRALQNYASYQWRYEVRRGGAGFLLRAYPVSDYPHQCTFETSERLMLTRSCPGTFGPQIQETNLVGGA